MLNLEAKRQKAKSADAQLRQTILNAVKEVDSSISGLQAVNDKKQILKEQTMQNKKIFEIAQKSYDIGQKSKIEVLDFEKNYLNSQLQLAKNKTQINLQEVKLYKELGGGWENY